MQKQVELTFTKSTKGTHVYSTDKTDAAVQSLYIKRDSLPSKPPATITLTIDFKGE